MSLEQKKKKILLGRNYVAEMKFIFLLH